MTTVAPDAATLTRVKTLSAWEQRPALTEGEVIAAIQAHPTVDRWGLTADVDTWTPTFDIYAAVAELWGIKAGRVAGDFSFTADEAQYDKGEVMAHCLAMEAKYAAMRAGAMNTGQGYDPLHGVVVNG